MKKYIISITILLFTVFSYSQNNKYFEAVYNIYYNTELPQIKKAKLEVDKTNGHSIFHIYKNKDSNTDTSVSTNDDGVSYTVKYSDLDRFIEMNFEKSTIYSKEVHRGNVYFVKDSILPLKWRLDYEDEKKIGSLLCKKATTHFRGRDYIAWYTLEIPLPYGPYKFHGLPGLIISISDSSKIFNWIITSYKLQEGKPKFEFYDELEPLITAKKYYSKIRYPSDNERKSIIQSKLPKGIKLVSVSTDTDIRKGVEIKFEWEEETKKN